MPISGTLLCLGRKKGCTNTKTQVFPRWVQKAGDQNALPWLERKRENRGEQEEGEKGSSVVSKQNILIKFILMFLG